MSLRLLGDTSAACGSHLCPTICSLQTVAARLNTVQTCWNASVAFRQAIASRELTALPLGNTSPGEGASFFENGTGESTVARFVAIKTTGVYRVDSSGSINNAGVSIISASSSTVSAVAFFKAPSASLQRTGESIVVLCVSVKGTEASVVATGSLFFPLKTRLTLFSLVTIFVCMKISNPSLVLFPTSLKISGASSAF